MTEDEKMDQELISVPEPEIKFKSITERDVYKVVSERDPNITLIEITGYGVQINFNMEYLRSLEDITAAGEAIGALFKDIILEKLLEYKQNT